MAFYMPPAFTQINLVKSIPFESVSACQTTAQMRSCLGRKLMNSGQDSSHGVLLINVSKNSLEKHQKLCKNFCMKPKSRKIMISSYKSSLASQTYKNTLRTLCIKYWHVPALDFIVEPLLRERPSIYF